MRARTVEENRGYMRSTLAEVLSPSPDRIQPRCMHYGTYGSCLNQHLLYDSHLTLNASILRDQLSTFIIMRMFDKTAAKITHFYVVLMTTLHHSSHLLHFPCHDTLFTW